ncbi:MAG: glycosyltransferase [Phycisphaerae bacterium]
MARQRPTRGAAAVPLRPYVNNAVESNVRTVSVVMLRPHPLPYAAADWDASAATVLRQQPPVGELIIVDNRPAPPPLAGPLRDGPPDTTRVVHLPGAYPNRAAMWNAGMSAATCDHVALIVNDDHAVHLRRSAIVTMLIAAARRPAAGMIYADYRRRHPHGTTTPVHLLDHHPGRLRETTDFGNLLLLTPRARRAVGPVDEAYTWADLYDLRLRITETCDIVHVAGHHDGELYDVLAARAPHDVFDYLRAGKPRQREYESAVTRHLQRIGAYLEPGHHVQPVHDAPHEQTSHAGCIASVVIPVHRRPEFIAHAVESALAQTVPDIEIIVVVNGGDADPTAHQVRRYMPGGDRYNARRPDVRLIVVDVNNIGLCLNLAITAARGRYYVQLDSDDRLKPDAVEKLINVFDADPTIGAVIGAYEVWDLDPTTGRIHRNPDIPIVTHDEWTDDNGRNNLLRTNGAGAPRAAHVNVIRDVGGFGVNDAPHARNYGEDYDLILRISERYRIARVWEPIYIVVRHPGGTDHRIDQATADRNDNAKDHIRLDAVRRRQRLNRHATSDT